MPMGRTSTVVAVLAFGLSAAWSAAQEAPQPSQAGKLLDPLDLRCNGGASLRVQVTITRLREGKKEASLPYAFVVPARLSPTFPVTHARMRMGVDTPVPVMLFEASDPKKANKSVQY